MCGIAGAIDLDGQGAISFDVLQAMADSLTHRGPDEEGFLQQDGVSLASRRLSIVGLFDGKQPISNEDNSVFVVFNGELFDHRKIRAQLEGRGHTFRTQCDTEVIPHLWEEYGEGMFDHLEGQFAFALYDNRQKRVILARDKIGICPLHWSQQQHRLLFASEIKGLLASGLIPVRADPHGINHLFTFFSMPGPVTCFEGVSSLLPGHYLDIRLNGDSASIRDRIHWEIDFPDAGQEENGLSKKQLVDEFERVMLEAVEKRLRADVPVVSYLSGGVDSSIVVAMASKIRGTPIPTYTIRIETPELDETTEAAVVADYLGCKTRVADCRNQDIMQTYPRLVGAAESPVIDTSCAALLLLAEDVNRTGIKVALTGEGSDEWLAGYPWFKIHKLLSYLDFIPGVRLSEVARRGFLMLSGTPSYPRHVVKRTRDIVGGHNGWLDIYGMVSSTKLRFFSESMHEVMTQSSPYADLQLNENRLRKWHPLNRSLYLGARAHLPGLLLNGKGDRVAMHSSVETRYPFLDEQVVSFLTKIHPRWKLAGFRDKYILRLLSERWLPKSIAWRRKAMFRAPLDSFHEENPPKFVDDLLSRESLRKTGYFDVESVLHWRQAFHKMRRGSTQRYSVEMGLAGVLSTQLWHHMFIDSCLADLPGLSKAA